MRLLSTSLSEILLKCHSTRTRQLKQVPESPADTGFKQEPLLFPCVWAKKQPRFPARDHLPGLALGKRNPQGRCFQIHLTVQQNSQDLPISCVFQRSPLSAPHTKTAWWIGLANLCLQALWMQQYSCPMCMSDWQEQDNILGVVFSASWELEDK